MNAPEATGEAVVTRGSVKLTRNAKGDCQFEVKVCVGESESDVAEAKAAAASIYRDLESEFIYGTGGAS